MTGAVALVALLVPARVGAAQARPRGPAPTPTVVLLAAVERDAALHFATLQRVGGDFTPTPQPTLPATATPAPITPAPAAVAGLPPPPSATPTLQEPSPTPPDVRGIAFSTATPLPGSLPTPVLDPVQAARIALGECDCCAQAALSCASFPQIFAFDAAAQACFEDCRRRGFGDLFGLDPDGDLYACSYRPLTSSPPGL